jgi:gas vesicle protein
MNEKSDDRSNGAVFFCGLLTGLGLGAGLAMLYAPKAGSELRRDLKDGASDLSQAAKDTWQDVATTATAAVQKGREAYEQSRGAVQDVADTVARSADRIQGAVKDATEAASSAAASGAAFWSSGGAAKRH